MISLAGLNEPQRQAAETIKGPVLILAGAGSGKTRTITYRIAHMVDNLGIDADKILAVSFTNKAATEMKERVETLLSKRKCRKMTLSTFHSLGVQVLKKEINKLGFSQNFNIYDTSDQLSIINQALRNLKAQRNFKKESILAKISLLKNNGIGPNEFLPSRFFDTESEYDMVSEYCYRYYSEKMKFYNAIDFDDILHLTVKIFEENEDVAKTYSEKFQYIMVDEYQDTNPMQFRLVKALTCTHNNLCVVGDDDQSIYAFRGADISNILNFEKRYPDATVVKLMENYRSTKPILALANGVIKQNKHRREKTLWTKNESDVKPVIWACADEIHEAQVITDQVVEHQSAGKHLGDIAILYRSNTQVPLLEDELRLSDVPYTIIGGQKFYDKKEVKDLIGYLALIKNQNDELALRRILNTPNRGIGNATLDKYLAFAGDNKITLFEALQDLSMLQTVGNQKIIPFINLIKKYKKTFATRNLNESISLLIDEVGYLNYIEKCYDNNKQVERRKNDIQMFIDSSKRFIDKFNGKVTLDDYLTRLLLQDSHSAKDDENNDDDDVRKNEITLMTLHSSKGLEFEKCFIIGVEEELLPHKKTIQEAGDVSEECRLFYVGVTRAKQELYMTYAKERKIHGREAPRSMSRFLFNIKSDGVFLEQDRTKMEHMSHEEATKKREDFFSSLVGLLD